MALLALTVASTARNATICPVASSVTVVDKFGMSSIVVLVVVSLAAVSHPTGNAAAKIELDEDSELRLD